MPDTIDALRDVMVEVDRFGYKCFSNEWTVIRARLFVRMMEHPEDAEPLLAAMQQAMGRLSALLPKPPDGGVGYE